jgi:nitrogen regulatory protein P-II 1
MKMAIAYTRTECTADVMCDLYEAGVGGLTCYIVHGMRSEKTYVSLFDAPLRSSSSARVAEVEVVCSDERIDEGVSVIARGAQTGNRGDGIIAVQDVEKGLRIRDVEPLS